ncbi:MAG TPA: hypothetical protein VIX58_09590 [Anaerolineae bacterium]
MRPYQLLGFLALVILTGCGIELVLVTPSPRPNVNVPPVIAQPGAGGFPNLVVKPAPQEITYAGCPPQGDGGDVDLNRRKNRVDESPQYFSVALETLVNLPHPTSIEGSRRRDWTSSAASQVAQYEGVPVAVEGFLADSKVEGPEATNCHSIDEVDFHVWIGPGANADRARSLVVEFTPRVRSKHAGWTATKMERLDTLHLRVRVSGWVLMDQEHPDQIGRTRGTLWEIHPVMQFEVQQGNQWIALDEVR